MLPDAVSGSYDYGRDPRVAEALMNEREAKSISEVAAVLRDEIIAGRYSGKDKAGKDRKVPSRNEIGDRFGLSAESGGVVLRILAAEGLITMQQGRGTFAEPVEPFRTLVTATRTGLVAPTVYTSALRRIERIEGADLSDLRAETFTGGIDVRVTVIARDAGFASGRASAVVRAALGDGWKITGASVTARPA